jgi:hypothetical protein
MQRITDMQKTLKTTAEEKFAAIQKKDKQLRTEKEKAQQVRLANIANLRALRLAKEATDRNAAEQAIAEKAGAKKKKSSR